MAKKRHWIVTTSEGRNVKAVAKALKSAGFEVGQVHDQIGTISGAADSAVLKKIRKIDGVADVSADAAVDIGPPNSRDTW